MRNLAYWKSRKVQIREIIIEYIHALEFADKKVKECEKRVLAKASNG